MSEEVEAAAGGEQEQQQPSIEDVAKQHGWNPDHDGPKKLSAEQWMERKPLFDRLKAQGDLIRQQNRSITRLEKLVTGMADTFKGATEAQYKKGIADAEARMQRAKADFDPEAYEQARDERDAIKAAQSQQPTTTQEEPAEVTEFCDRNPWFEKDAGMRADALDYRERFYKANPSGSIADALAYIEKKIRKDYPEAFNSQTEEPTKKPKPTAPAVEGSHSTPSADPFQKLRNSMSAEEKRIMHMFTKDGKMSEKEYLEAYAEVREK